MKLRSVFKYLALALTAFPASLLISSAASAATQSAAPSAKISFTFDDGYASALTQAAPTLAKYGFAGTDYIITGCVGMTTAPNTCRANTDASYMDWSQITGLRDTYGWEIGSHTVDHYCLASTGDGTDCQTNQLTPAEVNYELSQSKADLAAHGINAVDMSTPYGDYNNAVLANIAKYYQSQRGFADIGYNSWPYSDYYLRVEQVEGRVSVAQVEGYINTAKANNQWLILVFHDIKTRASRNPDDYEYSTANLDKIAAYVKAQQIPVVSVNDGLVKSDQNLLPDASFNSGIADGWRTDSPTSITADSGYNGSYPDPQNSIKLTSSVGATTHLFSPMVEVDPNATYMLKNFLNVVQTGGGAVGFYIDEYDAGGNWISGQYKATEPNSFVESMNFEYKPSSANVRQAALQIIITPTATSGGLLAYLDNTQWFPLTAVNLPPPTATNLVSNATFDAGIADGWRTDSPTTITADSGGNGSPNNPINSVKLTSSSQNTHLFSPAVTVNPSDSYSISSYLNLQQMTGGEVGYYIDEYDASGNWISGQYKTGVRSPGIRTVTLQYTPSSVNVKYASLQIIVVANSGITAYFDDVNWLAN